MKSLKYIYLFTILLSQTGCNPHLYLTSSAILDDNDYVFIAQYISDVGNRFSVGISVTSGQKADPTKNTAEASPDLLATTITLSPLPITRSFLYLSKAALFNNSVNVGVGTDGLLTSSDSSSTQQITNILTEIGQTAASVSEAATHFLGHPAPPRPATPKSDAETCVAAVAAHVKDAPFYSYFDKIDGTSEDHSLFTLTGQGGESLKIWLRIKIPPGIGHSKAATTADHDGIVAFLPLPSSAAIVCTVGIREAILLTPLSSINPYVASQYIDPQRGFFTNPQDTFTLTAGFLTGHKYSDQSSVKTIVDLATAPLRAALPATTVQTTTQVQTGGGKPDQTTKTTETTAGAAK